MEFLIPLLFVPFFILMWIGVTGLISVIGGWRGLARAHPMPAAVLETGETYTLQSVRLGYFANYNSSITVTVYMKGIRIVPIFLFSLFHGPIYIGYDAMEGITYGKFIFHYMRFRIAGRKIMITGKCVLKIKERIGSVVK